MALVNVVAAHGSAVYREEVNYWGICPRLLNNS